MSASDNNLLTEDATFKSSFCGISVVIWAAAREAEETSCCSIESLSNSDTEASADTSATIFSSGDDASAYGTPSFLPSHAKITFIGPYACMSITNVYIAWEVTVRKKVFALTHFLNTRSTGEIVHKENNDHQSTSILSSAQRDPQDIVILPKV